jgi:hypothetical protein
MSESPFELEEAMRLMRDECVRILLENVDLIQRNGHEKEAKTKREYAKAISHLNPSVILAAAGKKEAEPDSQKAFEAAAPEFHLNTMRKPYDNYPKGYYMYPVTNQSWELWQRAVQWADGRNT